MTRYREIFRNEELPLLTLLPATPYELAEWKQAIVQFNCHISFAGMLYSVPCEYIKRKVDVRVTDKTIEIFYNHNRIASHRRLYGRKGQYGTVTEHLCDIFLVKLVKRYTDSEQRNKYHPLNRQPEVVIL